jgi:small subunit ribosomal protein S14
MLKKLIIKDNLLRHSYKRTEPFEKLNKSLKKNLYFYGFNEKQSFEAFRKQTNQPKRVRIRNRCFLSGRGRGVHSMFKLSRMNVRKKGSEGLLPGIYKI